MTMLRAGLLLLIVPSVLLLAGYFSELAQVSDCLDQGGSFDYHLSQCDLVKTHPFVPFLVRYPVWVNGGLLLSVIGILLCLAGLFRRRTAGPSSRKHSA